MNRYSQAGEPAGQFVSALPFNETLKKCAFLITGALHTQPELTSCSWMVLFSLCNTAFQNPLSNRYSRQMEARSSLHSNRGCLNNGDLRAKACAALTMSR